MKTRACLICSALIAWSAAVHAAEKPADTGGRPRVVTLVASRYRFQPARITLKKGQPVILEIQSADRLHGFAIPALNVRLDIQPGQVQRIEIRPDKIGVLAFFCDIFCGSGHEEMAGEFRVE